MPTKSLDFLYKCLHKFGATINQLSLKIPEAPLKKALAVPPAVHVAHLVEHADGGRVGDAEQPGCRAHEPGRVLGHAGGGAALLVPQQLRDVGQGHDDAAAVGQAAGRLDL